VGCSRRVAAAYVGCSPTTIRNTAQRDPEFAERLRQAEHQAEIGYLRTIQKAGKEPKYWRAAAWALERKNPDDYVVRPPDVLTPDQVGRLLAECTQILVDEVPVEKYRKRVLRRLRQLFRWALPSGPASGRKLPFENAG